MTAARLPTSPFSDGANPDAALLELLDFEELDEVDELEDVEVPAVELLSDSTSALSLLSEAKAAETEVPLVQVDACTPEPETNLTVAHYEGKTVSVISSSNSKRTDRSATDQTKHT